MQLATRARAISSVLAFCTIFGVGGGCVAIYGFEDFEKDPPRPCKTPADCPMPTECGQYVCEGQVCKLSNPVEAGTLTSGNKRGDCLRLICDGNANVVADIDDTDVPYDGEACTRDLCQNGVPSNPLAPADTQCGTAPDVKCTNTGVCMGCSTPQDCGNDNPCITWICKDSICIKNQRSIGTEVENTIPGDCKRKLCDITGDSPDTLVIDDPTDDNNPCTFDYCTESGESKHDPSAAGAPCGPCKECAEDGTCQPCNGSTSDCHADRCVPKPKTCDSADECDSNYCRDGFCCDTECTSKCMACSNEKTGVLSGICAPITAGTDPDMECNSPTADTCRDGQCGCENGLKDGTEEGADCGGTCSVCTGHWNCGGATLCNGGGPEQSCCSVAGCPGCDDRGGDCNQLEGQTCALGAMPQVFTLGAVFEWTCAWSLSACKTITCNCVP